MGVLLTGTASLGEGSLDTELVVAPCFLISLGDVRGRSLVRRLEGVVRPMDSSSVVGGWFSWSSDPIVRAGSSFSSPDTTRRERLRRFVGSSDSRRQIS